MVEDRALAKAVRLTRIQHLLYRNPKGLTTRELARLCGVCVRTIQRDLRDLESDLKIPLAQEKDRYSILDGYVLPPVSLTLFEALAIFLALRLSLRNTDKSNPHIESAIQKIAKTLPSPLAEDVARSLKVFPSKPSDPVRDRIFEQVALAWETRRQMTIEYQSLHSSKAKKWLLEPYYVDMTGVGFSTYVIGHAKGEGKDGILTFKLDRIKAAEVLDKNYDIPEDFDAARLLSSSWGIIWGDEAEIKLKFSARVSRRVKETVWHPSQKVEDLEDGSCILTLQVGSALEITPWIRSWGPDVEVLEPKEVRRAFREFAAHLAKIYGC